MALPAIVPVSEMYRAPIDIDKKKGDIENTELNRRHNSLRRFFELGTVYTMIAGLLNILAIYDAWGGPVIVEPDRGKKRPRPPNDLSEDDEDTDDPPDS